MIVNGWLDWAEQHPASPSKLWGDINSLEAVFFHSAVGTMQGVIDVVDNPNSGRSVTAVIGEDGHTVQFYSILASPWANGSHEWNRKAIGIEFTGGYNGRGHTEDEPLTDLQTQSAIQLLKDLASFKNVDTSYWQRPSTLKEHREVYPTACPSGRITWEAILSGLQSVPMSRNFLYGDENGGREKRGKQLIDWNEGVEIWAYGDVAGTAVGQTWHNIGGVWQKVAE